MLRDTSELSHALAPILNLVARTSLLVLLAFGLGFIEGGLNLLLPIVKEALEVVDHLGINVLGVLNVLDLVVVLAVVLLKQDVALDAFQGVLELQGKLLEHLGELLLLFIFAYTPVGRLKAVNEWLEDVVDDDVQRGDGVLGDLTEEHVVIITRVGINWLAWGACADEVQTLTLEALLFTYLI